MSIEQQDPVEILRKLVDEEAAYEAWRYEHRPPKSIVVGDVDDGERVAGLTRESALNFGATALEALRRKDLYGSEERPSGL